MASAPTSRKTTPASRRRWRPRSIRFSLRAALVAVLLLCLAATFLRYEYKRREDRQAAIQSLRDAGADLTMRREDVPDFLVERFGAELFEYPVGIMYVHTAFRDRRPADEVLALAAQYGELESVQLGETDITDEGLRVLEHSEHLKFVELGSCPWLKGPGLKYLAGKKELTELDLEGSGITDTNLSKLGEDAPLQRLVLSYNPITDDAGPLLKRWPSVQVLSLDHTAVTDAVIRDLVPLHDLRKLDLAYTAISDESVQALSQIAKLESLELEGTAITSAGVERLRAALPGAKISWTDESEGLATVFQRIAASNEEGSTWLICDSLWFGDRHAVNLAPMTHLVELDLNSSVTDRGLVHLSGLVNLENVQLWFSPITGKGLRHLASLPKLRSLVMSCCPLVDERLTDFHGFARLEDLRLSDTPVTSNVASFLTSLPSLKYLDLAQTKVDDEILPTLAQLPHLQEVELWSTAVTKEGVAWLRNQAPHLKVTCDFD